MSYEELTCDRKNGLTEIRLKRSERRNSLAPSVIKELKETFENHRNDPDTRAILLTGSGDYFSVGADLKEAAEWAGEDKSEGLLEFRKSTEELHTVIIDIRRSPKPVIAGVNGPAAGAGLGLALAPDITLISDDAFLEFAYTKIALSGDAGTTFLLPRLVGMKKAKDLALRSPRIDPEDAVEMGLASEVIPSDDFEGRVREIAEDLASGPTKSLAMIKELINKSYNNTLESQLEDEEDFMIEALDSEDFIEGISTFLEKGEPDFKGK